MLIARCCQRVFPVVAGIPDLRCAIASWIDPAEDRRRAEALEAEVDPEDVEGSIRYVFRHREHWTDQMVEHRTRGILSSVARLRNEFSGWLAAAVTTSGPILDLGCGPGMAFAAIGSSRKALGLDVSLEWLVVAQRMARDAGADVEFAAGLAEALPLPDECLGAVIARDVLEHVGDQSGTMREVAHTLRPGGILAATTPNRFSVAAEPHVGIWGVGWLPRAWQSGYVHWRSALPYTYSRLLSARELRRLIHDSGLEGTVVPASIPEAEIEYFSGRRKRLARIYNHLLGNKPFRILATWLGAFFQVIAIKRRVAEVPALITPALLQD